ncbi:MAG: metalloregulator ArsR/SmtB family transcription factor [Planctomycetota bacterium]
MVKLIAPPERLDRAFASLADPTRRAIVDRLAQRDGLSVGEVAQPFADRMSLPAVSKHIRVLEAAGLLVQRKHGRVRRCHLLAEPIAEARAWIDHVSQFWADRLDAMAELAEATAPKAATEPATPKAKRTQRKA